MATSTTKRAGPETALRSRGGHGAPFATDRLDELLEAAGIDALVVTSKHNVQYLLGDYRFFFFDYMDAIGVSRYLPVLVYVKGRPDQAAYVGNRSWSSYEQELGRFWVPTVKPAASGTLDAIGLAVEHLTSLGAAAAAHRRRDGLPAGRRLQGARRRPARQPRSSTRCSRWSGCAPASAGGAGPLRQASERRRDVDARGHGRHGPGTTKRTSSRRCAGRRWRAASPSSTA